MNSSGLTRHLNLFRPLSAIAEIQRKLRSPSLGQYLPKIISGENWRNDIYDVQLTRQLASRATVSTRSTPNKVAQTKVAQSIMSNPFTPPFEQLPHSLPIFPLPGAIVLPDIELPLNIFEPRYLSMISDAIKTDRLIGMVQPIACTQPGGSTDDVEDVGTVQVADIGCAGRITSFQETHDGRIMIVLTGLCRFRIEEELNTIGGYRRVRPDWSEFRYDMSGSSAHIDIDELLAALNEYLTSQKIDADIHGARSSSASNIINTMAMHLPFDPADKQSLLESTDDTARGTLLMALCRASRDTDGNDDSMRH